MRRGNLLIALMATILVFTGAAFPQKDSVPKKQDKAMLASESVKELLLLLHTNNSGKISKQEWMKFMEAEFDRLDKDKKGEIGPEELRSSRLRAASQRFAEVGK